MNSEKSSEQQKHDPGKLAHVFSDACSHIAVARMIQEHLSNKQDIRKVTLQYVDLTQSKDILDLGCGFGYFTSGLKGYVHPEAHVMGLDIHSGNEIHFRKSCEKAGLKGSFVAADISWIKSLPPNSVDLIISSFSLYFFPEYIPYFSRLLKKNGHCIIVAHAVPHMHELSFFVKALFQSRGIDYGGELPYESLIRNFSSENGMELLKPWFDTISSYGYQSSLVFPDGDYESLMKYFKFKHTFFLPENGNNTDELIQLLLDKVKEEMKMHGKFLITKDDIIFICSDPKYSEQD